MYHCHILEHEDNGMMGQFTVELHGGQIQASLIAGALRMACFRRHASPGLIFPSDCGSRDPRPQWCVGADSKTHILCTIRTMAVPQCS